MSSYTTMGVGGPADAMYQAEQSRELAEVAGFLRDEGIPFMVVGKGSNLLVTDKGYRGAIILLKGSFTDISRKEESPSELHAGAGSSIVDLLLFCRRAELGGMEFLSWVPGTVGGAVAMNAGAFGRETGDYVNCLEMMNRQGEISEIVSSDLSFSYRRLEIEEGSIILSARFGLKHRIRAEIEKEIAFLMKKRKHSQPLAYPSAGSIFKNPPGDYAGRLIEEAGLKGRRMGGAMVSERHANFIINTGGARAEEILSLIAIVRQEVLKKSGIELEPEVRVVGQ